MWPMRRPVLSPRPFTIISSSANSVPSKKSTCAAAMRSCRSSVTRAQPGRIDEPAAAASTATPTVPSPISSVLTSPSSSQSGTFPGTGKSFDRQARQRLERLAEPDGLARDDVAADDVEDAVRADRVERGARAPDRERLALAQARAARPRDRRRCWSAARRRSANGVPRPSAASPASRESAGAGRSRR